jgi:hypothetical protein
VNLQDIEAPNSKLAVRYVSLRAAKAQPQRRLSKPSPGANGLQQFKHGGKLGLMDRFFCSGHGCALDNYAPTYVALSNIRCSGVTYLTTHVSVEAGSGRSTCLEIETYWPALQGTSWYYSQIVRILEDKKSPIAIPLREAMGAFDNDVVT